MNDHALVWGLGKSGFASAKLLHHDQWRVTVIDRNNNDVLAERAKSLQDLGIEVKLGFELTKEEFCRLKPCLTIVSPGIPWDHPILVMARAQRHKAIGEVELAWHYLYRVPWIAVTGTNGKTTTTALISAIFQQAGYHAPCCGNIGVPICEIALTKPAWVIAELSSYQIESSPSVHPKIGVWTTFTPDHLSRHGTIERYAAIKAHLLHQSQMPVLNADDPYLAQQRAQFPHAFWISTREKADAYIDRDWVYFQGKKILPLAEWQLLGNHNRQNLLLAVAAGCLGGISPDQIRAAVAQFRGIPHRLEPVLHQNGTVWINDSKATNYDAALTGLEAVEAPVILICGEEAKQGEPKAWLELISRKVVHVLLIGSAADLFAQFLSGIGFEAFTIVHDLDRAVVLASTMASQLGAKSVLFSPACASFDQYPNFEVRGDHFRQLCQEIGHG